MAGWWWSAIGAGVLAATAAVAASRTASGNVSHRYRQPWALRRSLVVVTLGAVGAVAAFILTYRATDGDDKDRFDVGIKAATATAAVAAGVLTWGRLELSRHEQRLAVDRDLTDRYGRAVDQLGNPSPVIQMGGVFAIERYALDAFALTGPHPDTDWRMALDLLADFAREGSRDPENGDSNVAAEPAAAKAVAAAVRVLGRFPGRTGHPVQGHLLAHVYLVGADLRGADLNHANLAGATLRQARLNGSKLTGATLLDATLSRADLCGADLSGAALACADLTNADLRSADLRGADLPNVSLVYADLAGAKLIDADLASADLTGVELTGADLTRADLAGANLSGAELVAADLTGAELAGANLAGVQHDGRTRWPEGFAPPPLRSGDSSP